MNEFVLVWVLMVFDTYRGALTYSPPVQTLADCERMQKFAQDESAVQWSRANRAKCVQVSVLKKGLGK